MRWSRPAAVPTAVIPETVGLLTGGWGFERDESLSAAKSVEETLTMRGHQVNVLDLTRPRDLPLVVQPPFCEVPFCFLTTTEELLVHPLLEAAGVRYGSSPAPVTAALYDKWIAQSVLASHGIGVPPTELVHTAGTVSQPSAAAYPLIVKPRRGGSSVGVSLVAKSDEYADGVAGVAEIDEWALVQAMVPGTEYTAFLLTSRVLGCLRVTGDGRPWLREEKQHNSRVFAQCQEPAVLDAFARVGEVLAMTGVRGLSRVDAIMSADAGLVVLDVNTQPYLGAGRGSSVWALCGSIGLTHYEFLQQIYLVDHTAELSLEPVGADRSTYEPVR